MPEAANGKADGVDEVVGAVLEVDNASSFQIKETNKFTSIIPYFKMDEHVLCLCFMNICFVIEKLGEKTKQIKNHNRTSITSVKKNT